MDGTFKSMDLWTENWDIQMRIKFGTQKYTVLWTEHWDTQVYVRMNVAYRCAPNQEPTNLWIYGSMDGIFGHIDGWHNHRNIQMSTKSGTYTYATNQDHTDQWFNGQNI